MDTALDDRGVPRRRGEVLAAIDGEHAATVIEAGFDRVRVVGVGNHMFDPNHHRIVEGRKRSGWDIIGLIDEYDDIFGMPACESLR